MGSVLPAISLIALCGACACAAVRTTPEPGKIVITKTSYDLWAKTSLAVVSSKGTVVLMDGFMTLPEVRPDLITVSHFHGDHFDPYLLGFFRCARSTSKAESFLYKDVRGEGLASTHHGDIDPLWPTNVVYVLNVDGLRVAHLGDFGQTNWTEEQQRALTGVDVLIAPVTDLLVPEERAVALIREIRPKMIFPTHCTRRGAGMLKAMADEVTVRDDWIAVGPEDLKGRGTRLVLLERSNYAFLFLRFLLMEFPGYPITKFAAAVILLIALVVVAVRRFLHKAPQR